MKLVKIILPPIAHYPQIAKTKMMHFRLTRLKAYHINGKRRADRTRTWRRPTFRNLRLNSLNSCGSFTQFFNAFIYPDFQITLVFTSAHLRICEIILFFSLNFSVIICFFSTFAYSWFIKPAKQKRRHCKITSSKKFLIIIYFDQLFWPIIYSRGF